MPGTQLIMHSRWFVSSIIKLTDLEKLDLITKISEHNLKSSQYFNSYTVQKHNLWNKIAPREPQVWWTFLSYPTTSAVFQNYILLRLQHLCYLFFLHPVNIFASLKNSTLPSHPHFLLILVVSWCTTLSAFVWSIPLMEETIICYFCPCFKSWSKITDWLYLLFYIILTYTTLKQNKGYFNRAIPNFYQVKKYMYSNHQ